MEFRLEKIVKSMVHEYYSVARELYDITSSVIAWFHDSEKVTLL